MNECPRLERVESLLAIRDIHLRHGHVQEIIIQNFRAKEDTKINYVGDWTSYNYRKAMQDGGYKEGDYLGGKMFPTLFEAS